MKALTPLLAYYVLSKCPTAKRFVSLPIHISCHLTKLLAVDDILCHTLCLFFTVFVFVFVFID